jgi:hypothetical protein
MKTYKINQKTVDLVRHIFNARIKYAVRPSTKVAYKTALDVFNYALDNNLECLDQFNYLQVADKEDK